MSYNIWYDEPTRIQEIIQEDAKEYEWIQKYEKIIIEKVGKEKIKEFNRKRWEEYWEEHKYKMTPTQKYYWRDLND